MSPQITPWATGPVAGAGATSDSSMAGGADDSPAAGPADRSPEAGGSPTLAATDLTVGYSTSPVLAGLDFCVPSGAFTAIIGPNGCGKSTLLKTLARTLRPSAGVVHLDGRALEQWRPKDLARRIALLPQDPVVPEGVSVRTLVQRGRHPYHRALRQWAPGDEQVIAAAMAATGVSGLAERRLGELSGGQRQRAWIAMVLAQDTDVVLLDEPTSFLDIAHQVEILHLCQDIRDQGRSVLAVLHDVNQAARYADHLVIMRSGQIIAHGPPSQVLTEDVVADVFDVPNQITPDPQTGAPMVVPLARFGGTEEDRRHAQGRAVMAPLMNLESRNG